MTVGIPEYLPAGTRYVVEGRRGAKGELHIVSRQVILPDGKAIEVRAPSFERPRDVAARAKTRRRRPSAKR